MTSTIGGFVLDSILSTAFIGIVDPRETRYSCTDSNDAVDKRRRIARMARFAIQELELWEIYCF